MSQPRRLFPRDDQMKSIGMRVTKAAADRLLALSEKHGIGQNRILSLMVENFSDELLVPLIEQTIKETRRTRKLDPDAVREFLTSLSPEDREKFLAGQ